MSLPLWVEAAAGQQLTDHQPGLGRCSQGLVAFRFEPTAAAGPTHAAHTFRASVAIEQARSLISVCHLAAAEIGVRTELGSCVAANDDDQLVIVVRGLPQLAATDVDTFVDHVHSWYAVRGDQWQGFDIPEPSQGLIAVCV